MNPYKKNPLGLINNERQRQIHEKGWTPEHDDESADTVNMMVRLTRKDSLTRRARAAKPTVARAAGFVTLTAAGGATIRYTVNGEYPGAASEIADVETYSVPFAEPASGALLRCVASVADKSESDVVEVQF